MLKFAVKNQSLMRLDSFRAAEDSVNYLVAEFDILTDDWDGATITATFSNGEKTVDAVLIENRCLVPWEVLVKPVPVKVSLFGVKGDKIITTDICRFSNSCTQERGSSGKDPTPDAYQQIINMIEAGKVKGPQGDPGPQGPRGETGQTGPQGPRGETGQTGPQGEIGQTGQTGPAGQDGHTPVKGVDYWTASDKQEIYAEAEQALRDQEQSSVAAIRSAGADEVEKVQIKGAETLESIPENYSAITAEVSGLKSDLSKYCEVEKTVQTADFYTGRYGDDGYYVLSNGWANISNPSKVFLTKGTVLKAVKPAFVKAYILKQYNADGTFTQLGGGFTEKEITEDGTYTVCVYTTYTTRQLTSEELVEIANGFSIELTYTKLRNDIDANANVIAEIQDDIDPRNRSGELASAEIHVDDFTVSGQTDSQIIKNCLRFAQSFKHRTIVFDRRDFHISESIMIPSDTTIIIDGVTVKQNDGVFDTMFRSDNMTMDANYPHGLAIDMTQCANIRIIGKNGAKISGCDNVNTSIITNPDKDWGTWGWKGILILITNCNNIEVAGLSLEKPHMWAVSFELCTNGYIHDLNFNTTEINMDGVDLRYGCKHFMIDTITGKTFDDSVALTCSAVRNRQNSDYPLGPNAVYPAQITQGLISDMTDDELAIEDVQVKNVLTGGSCRSAICYTNYGGIVRNCVFDTLEDAEDIDNRVAIFKAYGGNEYMAKSISNIRVNNIKSNNVYRPVQILCDVDDVWINKIRKSSWMANEITDSDGVTVTNLSNI